MKEGLWGQELRCTLNESPSEKEGKSVRLVDYSKRITPSMKVPPKRKGNKVAHVRAYTTLGPQ